jgi:hypothetical protein
LVTSRLLSSCCAIGLPLRRPALQQAFLIQSATETHLYKMTHVRYGLSLSDQAPRKTNNRTSRNPGHKPSQAHKQAQTPVMLIQMCRCCCQHSPGHKALGTSMQQASQSDRCVSGPNQTMHMSQLREPRPAPCCFRYSQGTGSVAVCPALSKSLCLCLLHAKGAHTRHTM